MGDNARYGTLRQWRQVQRLTQVLAIECIEEGSKGRHHRGSYIGPIAVKRFDKGLIRQLPFLLVSRTGECDHPRCGCSMQQFKCQASLAHTGISCEEEHLTTSMPGGVQPCSHGFEFAVASDQWSI